MQELVETLYEKKENKTCDPIQEHSHFWKHVNQQMGHFVNVVMVEKLRFLEMSTDLKVDVIKLEWPVM